MPRSAKEEILQDNVVCFGTGPSWKVKVELAGSLTRVRVPKNTTRAGKARD